MLVPLSVRIFSNLKDLLMSDEFKNKYRKSPKDFIRSRVLGFAELIALQLKSLVLSLSVELSNFLDILDEEKNYTKQAFSQARHKLKHQAFIALNEQFIADYYSYPQLKLYANKYLFLAVDGSMCQLPEEEAVGNYFGRWKNQYGSGMPMARISVLYDLLNQVSILHTIEPNHVSEKETFIGFRRAFDTKIFAKNYQCLYVMDRGYPSFTICKDLSLAGHSFVIRSKSSFCNEVKAFVKEDIAEKNICIPAKGRLVNGLEEDLELRIVRVLLNSEEYEYLLTNTDFSIQELNEIYRLRWGIETFYSFLKERMQIDNFSSRTVEGVLQDFYANLLTANMSLLLIKEAQEELDKEQKQKKNKHEYKINKNVALGILLKRIPLILLQPEVMQIELEKIRYKLKKNKIAVIPERSFVRRKMRRNRRKYHMHQKRAF